jgi:hypothetical protein
MLQMRSNSLRGSSGPSTTSHATGVNRVPGLGGTATSADPPTPIPPHPPPPHSPPPTLPDPGRCLDGQRIGCITRNRRLCSPSPAGPDCLVRAGPGSRPRVCSRARATRSAAIGAQDTEAEEPILAPFGGASRGSAPLRASANPAPGHQCSRPAHPRRLRRVQRVPAAVTILAAASLAEPAA